MPLTIPRDRLPLGVQACLRVARARLDEAAVLLRAGDQYATQAAVLFSFAIEEFGKAILLRQAYETGADPATITKLGDHVAKMAAATAVIPEAALLLRRGAFQRGAFQAGAFDVGDIVDFEARLAGLYVDWDDGWRFEREPVGSPWSVPPYPVADFSQVGDALARQDPRDWVPADRRPAPDAPGVRPTA